MPITPAAKHQSLAFAIGGMAPWCRRGRSDLIQAKLGRSTQIDMTSVNKLLHEGLRLFCGFGSGLITFTTFCKRNALLKPCMQDSD